MAKRNFAALGLALLLAAPTSDAREPLNPIAVDGCAKLARVVYAEVSSAAINGPGNSGPWLIDIGQGDISVCKTASKTVSQAFTSAMLSAGINVSWGGRAVDRRTNGDFCMSGFLSQCYPDRNPGGFATDSLTFGDNAALVRNSWAVVSQSVMREMYNPFSSDEVRFRDSDLKLRLGLSLRSKNVRDRY